MKVKIHKLLSYSSLKIKTSVYRKPQKDQNRTFAARALINHIFAGDGEFKRTYKKLQRHRTDASRFIFIIPLPG